MNPPSAIQGAMSRDRKPFTYTPGGLDLSEIKSERMAKRLMRNAMNQGVPETPAQTIQSPPILSTPTAVPNFNCLPVQVFPTFNLPANPKSLLRTRSNTDQPREPTLQRVPPTSQFVNNTKSSVEYNDILTKNTPMYSQVNNNRPLSMYEYSTPPDYGYSLPRKNYGSDGFTAVLPEISYEAEYFQVPPKINSDITNTTSVLPKNDDQINTSRNINLDNKVDISIKPLPEINSVNASIITNPVEDTETDNKQKEVKIVKKQVKKENKVEDQNGNRNGDVDIEAELTMKLPTKKSAAKTETKVEVMKKILPDGTVEEVKKTTTKTTIDGKTEITTKTETRTLPKEEADAEIEVMEEEEEENDVVVQEEEDDNEEEVIEEPTKCKVKNTITEETTPIKENGQQDNIIRKEERTETKTTRKVVVVQNPEKEEQQSEEIEEEEDEEIEEAEPVTVVIKKQSEKQEIALNDIKTEEDEEDIAENETIQVDKTVQKNEIVKQEEEEVEDEEVEEEEEEDKEETKVDVIRDQPPKGEEEEQIEEEEEYEEAESKEIEEKVEKQSETIKQIAVQKEEDEESEYTEEETELEKEISIKGTDEEPKVKHNEKQKNHELTEEVQEEKQTIQEAKEAKQEPEVETLEPLKSAPAEKIPLREPSIPLEKVEDVEIKPIGPAEVITKSHTQNTEIITSINKPTGPLSTQTEYNKIENIVTVNRTTKVLDHAYENITQQGIPTLKTYFSPTVDRILSTPQPNRPYQPVYPPEPTTERRHSLLLERLSMERQMPTDIYQYNNQSTEQQRQWSQEPQAEVLTVSNVKPSSITNQQWYQQKDNVIYNNMTPTAPTPVPSWTQPQSKPLPQPKYQPQPQFQPPVTPQPQYQPSYTENIQDRTSNTYQQNIYSTYTPRPSNWGSSNVSNIDTLPSINTPNQYTFLNKDSSENYQKTTQQYSSSYVPPPWEQDSSYVTDNSTQNYYQPLPQTSTFTPTTAQGWKTPPNSKFSKPAPTAYVPPAPNQSFVKPVTSADPPRNSGRKTYYSEYERRYISVPEATYVPNETKFQPQPDPSPQYYYDNNEPSETVEHEWRKELREFTEKSQTEQRTETAVQPPWEVDSKYQTKLPSVTYTPTPTWSQTLRPRSWRERSFEAEYVGSKEWPKTNTLGRGRPLSSYGKNVEVPIPERVRGVSVDRYNPNNYQSPISSEHPPVQTHTLNPPVPHANYHNPNVPAYHTRASAEPRESQASYQQPRAWREARVSPLQSRSFKYLQWITGTED